MNGEHGLFGKDIAVVLRLHENGKFGRFPTDLFLGVFFGGEVLEQRSVSFEVKSKIFLLIVITIRFYDDSDYFLFMLKGLE